MIDYLKAAKIHIEGDGLRIITQNSSSDGDYLCVWTSWTNLSPVSKDKMPINKDKFESFLKTLDIPIKMVDYRMDIAETFDTIRNSKLCLGYEGMGQQIAYHYGKPIITMSNLVQVSKNTGGPESRIANDLKTVRRYLNVH